MSTNREQSLRILDNALWRIARERGECAYADSAEKDRPTPCDCARCVAIAALEASKNWRFRGSHVDRVQSGQWPREAKIQAAWMKLATSSPDPDLLLSNILSQDEAPSERDWYVATSIVQWLATNVGMTVLEAAGFKYAQWEQDGALEKFKRQQENEAINNKLREGKP